ncbi:CHAT domain-containing protein [Kitasatospora sp. NPDC059571]|uniref:CHAT domain-containing protein n=1 Tax=Kitasatospora sp. NPDC059571 TaxID=3346871 RepID=UPI0036808AE7
MNTADPIPRSQQERTLIAFRRSGLWPRVSAGTRQALEELLRDGTLDRDGFANALDDILLDDAAAMALFEEFVVSREAGPRAVGPWPVPATAPDPAGIPTATAPEAARFPAEAADDAAETDDRHLNLCLTWPLSRRVVPPDLRLGAGLRYELRVDIGARSGHSLLAPGTPFPDGQLDHIDAGGTGDWLDVTVLSEDFAVPVQRHAMFLPLAGPSWVCPCPPGGAHGCTADHRGGHLRIPLDAPPHPGPARLRLVVSHRGNQLQSAALTVLVDTREAPHGSTTAVIDYTLTGEFTGLDRLPRRTAAVRVSRGPAGELVMDFDGAARPVSTSWLTEHQVQDALSRTRRVLTGVHAAVDEGRNLLDPDNGKPAGEFEEDLKRLAAVGWDLFHLLAPTVAQRRALHALLGPPAEIQVCRGSRQTVMFPWAVVYDIPVDPRAPWSPCAAGLAAAGRAAATRASGPRSCPDEASHGLNSLCPFGFWGFRHSIEQPASRRGGGRLSLRAGRGTAAPALAIGRSLALDAGLSSRHLAALRVQFAPGTVGDHVARDDLRRALASGDQDCVYFYCHGRHGKGAAADTTALEIGQQEEFTPSALTAWATHRDWQGWARTAPLVFLNGCHTVDTTPSSWLTFVDAFTDLDAAGVVGTEISVDQAFATEVAERFWSHLLAGGTVGSALHTVRTELLAKGNVLGLAYTAYCSADLRLRAG